MNNVPFTLEIEEIETLVRSFGEIERISFNKNGFKRSKQPRSIEVRVTFVSVFSAEKMINSDHPILKGIQITTILAVRIKK